jgi:sirohydrochlorin ferrochelatase
MDPLPPNTGIIVVDHGSRMPAANALLDGVVALYREATGAAIVEPAHMELAAPTLEDAVARCIEQGARTIVVHPYFLAPGRHSTGDIPRMVEELAPRHPEVHFHVTEPLGLDPAMAGIMHRRILASLDRPR